YDEWYADVSDVEGTVARVVELAGDHPVLELGIGTGRVALPLAAAGLSVSGIDASAAMLDRLRAKPGGGALAVARGDMADVDALAPPPGARFGVVLAAFNTLFNLVDADEQRRCLAGAAARLAPGGCVVVEGNVFDPAGLGPAGDSVAVRSLTPERVVLSVSRADPAGHRLSGQFVDLVDGAPVRLRPWALRTTTPAELDDLAGAGGLVLAERWGGWRGEPFTDESDVHVSVYRIAPV
ncbi:MAG: class I SAM-dependent methyltransferase, partial [Acidimicrobiales bacterium]|nr:class I SAM-dependent methyltransferase [Acidimicrobiales bacterium]